MVIDMNMERVQDYVAESFAGENDDSILMCYVCQVKFTSLYNKQSHYSGKLHLQTMVKNLNEVIKSIDNPKVNSERNRIGVASSLEDVAKDYHGMY